MIRTVLTASAAILMSAGAAIAHPGHEEIPGTLHAIAHEIGGLDILLAIATLAVAAGLAARPILNRVRGRKRD